MSLLVLGKWVCSKTYINQRIPLCIALNFDLHFNVHNEDVDSSLLMIWMPMVDACFKYCRTTNNSNFLTGRGSYHHHRLIVSLFIIVSPDTRPASKLF